MQAISRINLQHREEYAQAGPTAARNENEREGLEKRYEYIAPAWFVRFIWPDWPAEKSDELAANVSNLHCAHPELIPVQRSSEEWRRITQGWEADPESAEVIGCAFQANFGEKVRWVKSARDSRGRIGATCRVEGFPDFSLQLSWRGPLITQQAGLIPREYRPAFQKTYSLILNWATGRIQPILDALKEGLSALYGDRFRGLYVFGSYARPDAGVKLPMDSDLDLALVLSDFDNPYEERTRIGGMVADLSLEHEIVISIKVIREDDYNNRKTNFTSVISKYAIPA